MKNILLNMILIIGQVLKIRYKKLWQGKYGIFFPRVTKTYEGNKLNEGRTPTISAFKDDKFRFLLHSEFEEHRATRFILYSKILKQPRKLR